MALAVGSYVAAIRAGSLLNGFLGDKPLFGRVVADAGGGDWDVVWEDGSETLSVAGTSLDQITSIAVSPPAAGVVRVVDSQGDTISGYYDCLMVAGYERRAGGVSDTGDYALLRALNEEQYLEVTYASNYIVLEDR